MGTLTGIIEHMNREYGKKEKWFVEEIKKAKNEIATLTNQIDGLEREYENYLSEAKQVREKIAEFCKVCGMCEEKDAPWRTHWCASDDDKPAMKKLEVKKNELWCKQMKVLDVLQKTHIRLKYVQNTIRKHTFYLEKLYWEGE